MSRRARRSTGACSHADGAIRLRRNARFVSSRYWKGMESIDLSEIRRLYREGTNIIDYLRQKLGAQYNTEQCVEISYDMQAGSYVQHVESNPEAEGRYHAELADVLRKYVAAGDVLVDVGTGEMTTLA